MGMNVLIGAIVDDLNVRFGHGFVGWKRVVSYRTSK